MTFEEKFPELSKHPLIIEYEHTGIKDTINIYCLSKSWVVQQIENLMDEYPEDVSLKILYKKLGVLPTFKEVLGE